MPNYFENYFKDIHSHLNSVVLSDLIKAASLIGECAKVKGKVILIGNGGSSSIASHISVDLSKAAKIRAITFNESNLITCYANDYGYENWLSESIRTYADSNDLVIAISSSGQSPNIVKAMMESEKMGLKTISLTGFSIDNPVKKFGDVNLWVDSKNYNYIEMTHHIWLVAIVDFLVEKR
jgi:D-sedoheptulose 7-phosphate isomerase